MRRAIGHAPTAAQMAPLLRRLVRQAGALRPATALQRCLPSEGRLVLVGGTSAARDAAVGRGVESRPPTGVVPRSEACSSSDDGRQPPCAEGGRPISRISLPQPLVRLLGAADDARARACDMVCVAAALGPLLVSLAMGLGPLHATGAFRLPKSLCLAVANSHGDGGEGEGGSGGGKKMTAAEKLSKKDKGPSSDEERPKTKPPKLAMPATGSAAAKAPSGASPAPGRPPPDAVPTKPPKVNSARGAKKATDNPLGGGGPIGSARSKPAKAAATASAGPLPTSARTTKQAASFAPAVKTAEAQAATSTDKVPVVPSARAMSAPTKVSKAAAAKGPVADKKIDLFLEPDQPWPVGMVTAPIPPLPPNAKKAAGLPVISPAGTRPRGRQDGAPSRHDLAPVEIEKGKPGWTLLFNCFKARFEVISGDATLLSDHDPFDLKGPRSGISIGRIKISPEKGTPLMNRVEFPNEWLPAEVHGVQHDYYQGEGTLDIKIEWRLEGGKVEALLIRVTPWLAYACALGCRMQIRKPGEAEGRMCTVQRVLPDDRCVVRVDGLSGMDPKKAVGSSEDVVDASPSTCVPTSSRRYPVGAKLLVLHEGACSDATVEDWQGPIEPKEGSRHRLWLAQGGAVFGWVTCKTTSGTNNLIPATAEVPEGADAMETAARVAQGEIEFLVGDTMKVVTPQPLVMRAGCPLSTGRVGVLPPGTAVRLLETRLHDGGLRARVERVAAEEDAVVITADLNEVNHSVQRFPSAAEYESARSSYCDEVRKQLEFVEDAITGSDLPIAEQVIYVNAGEYSDQAKNMRPEWKAVREGIDLVEVLLKPSKRRPEGMHTAQPGLVVAGPGTGTTWMVRQVVHSMATRLTDSDAMGEGGVRLVPVIVFVQRIVRLLRETGQDPKLVVTKRRMMPWYIENEFPGKALKLFRECLCQAYDMRALVIMVDGVDEAASLRLHVEEFIQYELVPSGNRLLVTSRPEGITLPLYLTNFSIVSLRPLTEGQQRRVAQSQMRGSAFYEHLVSITAARKKQDELWLEHYPSEAIRTKLEGIEYVPPESSTPPITPPLSPVPTGIAGAPAGAPAADGTDEPDDGEQSAIDTLDQLIRTVASEAGMATEDVDNVSAC